MLLLLLLLLQQSLQLWRREDQGTESPPSPSLLLLLLPTEQSSAQGRESRAQASQLCRQALLLQQLLPCLQDAVTAGAGQQLLQSHSGQPGLRLTACSAREQRSAQQGLTGSARAAGIIPAEAQQGRAQGAAACALLSAACRGCSSA